MSGILEYNDENAGYHGGKMAKTRATSLGHELKELGLRKKRLGDNLGDDDCGKSHSDKQRRSLQDFSNVNGGGGGSYPLCNQRKPYAIPERSGHLSKSQFHKTDHDDHDVQGVHQTKISRLLKRRVKDRTCDVSEVIPPERIVPNDEPMDIDMPMMILKNSLKSPPPGVRDIDLVNDPMNSSQYGQDIMNYLQARDTTLQRSAAYTSKGEITVKMRGVLVDWLGQVQTYEGLTSESLHMCVFMIDRYLTLKLIPLAQLQLLGVSCILIAAKVIERFPPEIPALCRLTADAYRPNEVLTMEREVLNRLQFDLNIPGPIVFLDRFLLVDKHEDEVENLCLYLMDLSLINTMFVRYPASKIAASTLYLARFLFHCGPTWTPALTFYTKYTRDNIMPCVRLFAQAVSKAENSSFQNARSKFNTKTFGFISMNSMLDKCQVLVADGIDSSD